MKRLVMTITLTLAAIGALACQSGTNSNVQVNTGAAGNSAANTSVTNQNSIPAKGNSMMPGDTMMKSSPDAAAQPYDLQFIDTMTEHHNSAVRMAKMAVEKTQNPEVKAFAQKIVADQTRENEQMKAWREKWFAGKAPAMNMDLPGMMDSMKNMGPAMKSMETATGKAFDIAFVDAMIPHHTAAVAMAKDALSKSERPEITSLATAMIKAQDAEIVKMRAWKAAWSK